MRTGLALVRRFISGWRLYDQTYPEHDPTDFEHGAEHVGCRVEG
jgi:hypothetical protein